MKYFFTIFFVLILITVQAQQLNPLTNKDQSYIDELNEFAETLILQESYQDAANTYNQISVFYWQKGFARDAIEFFLKSVELNKKTGNLSDIKALYTNIGVIYTDMEEVDKALDFFLLSLEVRKRLGVKEDISAGHIDVAFIYAILNQIEDAISHLEEALAIATEVSNPNLILNCYQMLTTNYDKIGNTGKSDEYFNKFTAYKAYQEEEGLKDDLCIVLSI